MIRNRDWLSILIICLLLITSICGILSMNFNQSYEIVNQYGDIVKIFGSGIYSGDSYFKAPILIGCDILVLILLTPALIITVFKCSKQNTLKNTLLKFSWYTVVLYYASSIAFGVKYNSLHLVYILLFACALFGMFCILREMDYSNLVFDATKGVNVFLFLCGVALIIAWMPDIIPSIINSKSLALIEIYTTEITYVLDMGIIAPLCFVCILLLKKNDSLGIIILASILQMCFFVGMMIIPQSICQLLSGASIPLPVILTKGASFIVLGTFAYYFNHKLYKDL